MVKKMAVVVSLLHEINISSHFECLGSISLLFASDGILIGLRFYEVETQILPTLSSYASVQSKNLKHFVGLRCA
jgi:hypothetical protein